MFNAVEDMNTKVDTACVMIMNNLQLTKSAVQIPEPDANGPSKKFQSFRRYVAQLLADQDNITETSSEAILSTIEKINPSILEDHKTEESHEPNSKVPFSDESDLDPEKVLNYYQSPEKVIVDLGLQ